MRIRSKTYEVLIVNDRAYGPYTFDYYTQRNNKRDSVLFYTNLG